MSKGPWPSVSGPWRPENMKTTGCHSSFLHLLNAGDKGWGKSKKTETPLARSNRSQEASPLLGDKGGGGDGPSSSKCTARKKRRGGSALTHRRGKERKEKRLEGKKGASTPAPNLLSLSGVEGGGGEEATSNLCPHVKKGEENDPLS